MLREASLAARLPRRRRGLIATLSAWAAIARQRRKLARLDEAAMRDMGLTAAGIAAEIRRKPWDAPGQRKG